MKLEDYIIKTALDNQDWRAAVDVLASHFGVGHDVVESAFADDEQPNRIWSSDRGAPEVRFSHGDVRYCWTEGTGFYNEPVVGLRRPHFIIWLVRKESTGIGRHYNED